MKIQDFLTTHPVFTHKEFVDFLYTQGSNNIRTRETILRHYINTGRLLRIRRGLFLTVPRAITPEECPVDPYLIASRISPDSVLAYHTALELHGKSYSTYDEFVHLTESGSRPLLFRDLRFKSVTFPNKLKNKGMELFDVITVERSGMDVQVTSLERTLVDELDRPLLSGTWEEIWRSLELVEFFDIDKVVAYATLLGNSTTSSKVGFFLEQYKDRLMPNDQHFNQLRSLKPLKPHYMTREGRRSGRLVKEWNLIVPNEILEKQWEEIS